MCRDAPGRRRLACACAAWAPLVSPAQPRDRRGGAWPRPGAAGACTTASPGASARAPAPSAGPRPTPVLRGPRAGRFGPDRGRRGRSRAAATAWHHPGAAARHRREDRCRLRTARRGRERRRAARGRRVPGDSRQRPGDARRRTGTAVAAGSGARGGPDPPPGRRSDRCAPRRSQSGGFSLAAPSGGHAVRLSRARAKSDSASQSQDSSRRPVRARRASKLARVYLHDSSVRISWPRRSRSSRPAPGTRTR